MQGLSEIERAGCTKILELMSKGDLYSLSDTVTNKLIVVENETAWKIVTCVKFTLLRQNSTNYEQFICSCRRSPAHPCPKATEAILSFTLNAEELLRRKKVLRDLIFKYLAKEGVAMPPNTEKHQLVKRTLELWSSGEAAVDERCLRENDERRQSQSDSTSMKAEVGYDPLVLGQQFCKWFFQLLNSQNLSLGQQPQDWGPQHFWPDVKLCLLSSAGSEQKEEFLGAELVSHRLLALTKEERLLLSPNLEPHGLRALASPHGLVLVAVAGTIHRDEACLGIFEQIFGLIRSPLENNSWKIKFVNLKVRGQDAVGGTEMTAPALNYNSSELQLLCS